MGIVRDDLEVTTVVPVEERCYICGKGNVIDDMQGQRIMSRIYGMCERVEIKGADWRMKGAC